MSERVSHLLTLFDALPEVDKRSAMAEILRRSRQDEADIPSSQFDALASERFSVLDVEEAACATDR